ncbi:flagellar hook protein FlgE [Clostridium sp. D2Q-14]|uniref:flagellar hook protein FlgE n=1 Tax=Anaeromonas gelatinilytica TaxID=2683194 RepID=UPI00193BDCD7|nr:flagellar hook protein FlgE [Anaeromonas gelatinilytica]MBS4536047.1 flagellar hook protein FlgE [Anaeromonas gelatinilytica]
MMSSMYSAVSGLATHQKKMDVIGNNIANVNTIGYKKGQAVFKEIFSQTIQGAGAPQGGKGGTNPQQIGLGVDLGAVTTIHTQGGVQRTGKPTDLMIDGEGFFIVSDDESLNNRYYTRAGNFDRDEAGNLITVDGMKVLGYNTDGELVPLRIDKTERVPSVASNMIGIIGNLDSRLAEDEVYNTDTTIKDSLGNSYKVNFEFKKTGDSNTWELAIGSIENISNGDIVNIDNPSAPIEITFGDSGELNTINGSGTDFNIDIQIEDIDGSFFGNGDDIINLDLSKLSQDANKNDAKGFDGGKDGESGSASGNLTGFSISADGVITGVFSNGMNKTLGQIALAEFDNNSGLEKIGNNLFQVTPNSGEPQINTPGSSGLGDIKATSLEMSNVDLSMEFTDMITTQRGFQANSRVITTSDEMLQELTNLKR